MLDAEEHPDDFSASMTDAAVLWLLEGRPGIDTSAALDLAEDACFYLEGMTFSSSDPMIPLALEQAWELVD